MGQFAELDRRFRELMGEEYTPLSLRLRRATSWGLRGDEEEDKDPPDHDAAFIFYWIAFNALYGEYAADDSEKREWESIRTYLRRLVPLDNQLSIYAVLLGNDKDVGSLLDNQYVFRNFWKYRHGVPRFENWRQRFDEENSKAKGALRRSGVITVLQTLFDRLYVLRNQMLHGSATWGSKVNRAQVVAGAGLMGCLLPRFVELMLDNPDGDFGDPYYPVVNQPDDWK